MSTDATRTPDDATTKGQDYGREALHELLDAVAKGSVSPTDAAGKLRSVFDEHVVAGDAHVDHHRALRTGMPEVIFGESKTAVQIAEISRALSHHSKEPVITTRVSPEVYEELQGMQDLPNLRYSPVARIVTVGGQDGPSAAARARWHGPLVVVSAGTTDLPVAEEAAQVAEHFGIEVERLWDVGVAGIHRILARRHVLEGARCIIVAAGMDGALPSVVGGLVDTPVVAVPTRVGYGASFGGVSAMLTMLNSCASGVAVVNIDNGFGAAALAAKILMKRE